METVVLSPGDGVLTRRIKARCREIKFFVDEQTRWNGYGYEITGYHVPKSIFEEEFERRDKENATRQQRQQEEHLKELKRQELEQERRRNAHLEELKARFPKLSSEQITEIEYLPIFTPEQLGYQYGRGTRTYWERLGYRVFGTRSGVVVRGGRVYSVFGNHALIEKKTTVSVEDRWEDFCRRFGRLTALAEALRLANRLQKVRNIRGFYDLKDQWIRVHQDVLVEGRIARVENKVCWDCDGDGHDEYGEEPCWKCNGTGIFLSRTLYEHRFEIEGKRYTFHSYVRPHQVSDEPGADAKTYGRPFASGELPIPPQSHLVEMVQIGLSEMVSQSAVMKRT